MNTNKPFIIILCARILVTLGAWAGAIALLWKFEYLSQWTQVDNLLGALPAALAVVGAACVTALAWIRYSKFTAPVAVFLAAVVIASAALFPTALRCDWWAVGETDYAGDSPDLTLYEPFREDTLAASLDEEATLRLAQDLPALDGATALYPLYSAFARAVYDEQAYSPEKVVCTNTAGAYRSIIQGTADIVFVAAPSESQRQMAKESGAELVFTPIGREAFVFVAGRTNPVENLTRQQIYNIYTGKTARWSTLGWEEGGEIIAFRRPETSGSESGLVNLVMRGRQVAAPRPLPDKSLVGTNSLMKQVAVWYNGVQPALGYSYRYFAQTMYHNPETKLLSVDGFAPTKENIASGDYPFVGEIYAVTRGKPQGDVKLLLDWILSAQGQLLVERTGYTPLAAQ